MVALHESHLDALLLRLLASTLHIAADTHGRIMRREHNPDSLLNTILRPLLNTILNERRSMLQALIADIASIGIITLQLLLQFTDLLIRMLTQREHTADDRLIAIR